jgi:hypothetical protein
MLFLPTPEAKKYLEDVRAFADRRGPEIRAKLESKIQYLTEFGGHRDGELVDPSRFVVIIIPDSAPFSFSIGWYKRKESLGTTQIPIEKFADLKTRGSFYDFYMNGGMIYYGPGDNGVGGPQFSVRSGSEKDEDWSVNT